MDEAAKLKVAQAAEQELLKEVGGLRGLGGCGAVGIESGVAVRGGRGRGGDPC